ncbi:MAG: helix-turn-helix transcriptional regulator [Lachnospiraceae bacterium]|jgi:transcriptional regulator with XRE-family HTH domain|nr:helix-turn-helix transcriptional regulator [Lachnospiraceae bacterium]
MHERIRKLRKTLELTQQEFGKRIGMKRNSIALIEGGRNTSEQTIFAICREFNVNEEWLRTGNGKMFNLVPEEDLYSKAAASILKDNDALAIEALKLYFELSPEAKKSVTDYILQLSDMIRKYNTKV